MTILALLIALALERVAVKTQPWQAQHYAGQYFSWLHEKAWLSDDSGLIHWFAIALVPAIIVGVIIDIVPGALLEFILQTLILFICLGSQTLRDTYKCFLQAANRGDLESCYLYSQQMGHCESKPDQADSFGLKLVWLNYQHYAAVVLWFIVFDAPGAVFYVLVREAFDYACADENLSVSESQKLRHLADWVPVRFASFGMLLVGNFAQGLTVWLVALFNFSEAPARTMMHVSAVSEILPSDDAKQEDPTLEPSMLVKLAKRNMMFLLVAVSVLTFTGIV